MEIFLAIVILIASFALIIFGGDKFVDSSVGIAKKIKIPTAIIGATLVSIGTTIPELLVTIFSGSNEASGLAVGNAIGSIIFNTCLIGGVLLVCIRLTIQKNVFPAFILLIFSVAITGVMSVNQRIALAESFILLILFIIFAIINFVSAKRTPQVSIQNAEKERPIWFFVLMFVISAAMIGTGAYFMVEKAKFLAHMAGVSDTIIGLTIVSFGTSLPELITMISSLRKKEAGLGLGNIVGSNIINCTLLIGITGLFNASEGLPISKDTLFVSLPVAILTTLILLLPTIIKKKTYKWQGISLISAYALYYVFLILNAFGVIVFA